MSDFQKKLENYADLVIRVGINLQRGQTLSVNAPITAAPFVRLAVQKAYDAGAKNVYVDWHDEAVTLIRYLSAPEEALHEFPLWKAAGYEEMAEGGAAFLSISSTNPDLLKDVAPNRIAAANKANAIAMKKFRTYTQTGKVSWAIASVPSDEWAQKVFPELSLEEAIDQLWDKIFTVTRIDQENPVKAWENHIVALNKRLKYLNTTSFRKLYFYDGKTDFAMALHPDHQWIGGGIKNQKSIYFVPNMPTEEVFSAPVRDSLEGRVYSTKPLNYGGKLIENFSLTFQAGKVVDFTAETGYESLKQLLETDEGAAYIGEVALVPHHSPVSNANVIFYNTLFDENASVHLALGSAYPLCLKGGAELTNEDLAEKGANISLIHVDFMIGSEALNIDGETADGERVPIFRNGNWA